MALRWSITTLARHVPTYHRTLESSHSFSSSRSESSFGIGGGGLANSFGSAINQSNSYSFEKEFSISSNGISTYTMSFSSSATIMSLQTRSLAGSPGPSSSSESFMGTTIITSSTSSGETGISTTGYTFISTQYTSLTANAGGTTSTTTQTFIETEVTGSTSRDNTSSSYSLQASINTTTTTAKTITTSTSAVVNLITTGATRPITTTSLNSITTVLTTTTIGSTTNVFFQQSGIFPTTTSTSTATTFDRTTVGATGTVSIATMFATAWKVSSNEWGAFVTGEGSGRIMDLCETISGGEVVLITPNTSWSLSPTSAATSSTIGANPYTTLDIVTHNLTSIAGHSITTATTTNLGFPIKTYVITSSIIPFTNSFFDGNSSVITTSVLLQSTVTLTATAVGPIYNTTTSVSTTFFDKFTAVSSASLVFSYFSLLRGSGFGTQSFEVGIGGTETSADPITNKLVNTGFDWSISSTTSTAEAGVDTDGNPSGDTFAMSSAETHYVRNGMSCEESVVGVFSASLASSVQWSLYQQSYSTSSFATFNAPVAVAILIPNESFSNDTPGSTYTPALNSNFIIPATFKLRADGAMVPFSMTRSTAELTALRNTTGGSGTSVAYTAYTTFKWKYSKESLSITTQSRYVTVDGFSTTSNSTSIIIGTAGGRDIIYRNLFSQLPFLSTTNIDTATTTTRLMPVGGKQRFNSHATVVGQSGIYLYTEYFRVGNVTSSATYTSHVVDVHSSVLDNEQTLSVFEQVESYLVIGPPPNNATIGGGEVRTFSRNVTDKA
jgi:hypothetical protein